VFKDHFSIPSNPFWGLFLIWALACLLFLFGLGDLPLRDFDEATVARVALEISNSKGIDQLLPTLWGAEYLNKPPGLHLLIAAVINLSRSLSSQVETLPSEFVVRLAPALLSTLVVPLGGLIQWQLRPKEPIASLATAGILLTLLPLARHGRLAMLDGAQLSAMALLWLILVSVDTSKQDRIRAFCAGLVSSFLLLLKAPFLMPALLAGVIPIFLEKKVKDFSIGLLIFLFCLGLLPGISWHLWHAIHRGSDALWLWGGDGATRVLFSAGEGSDLGFLVPLIEIIEGGWPWLLLWPIGLLWAFSERQTRWGKWVLSTQLVLAFAILPLKTQLPWYGHPLWLPFALVCGTPFAWLINRDSSKSTPAKYLLARVPYLLIAVGSGLVLLGLLSTFGLFASFRLYSGIALAAGLGWLLGAWLLTRSLKIQRLFGGITIAFGSFIALLILMGSGFWLWELNESWSVKPVAEMIAKANATSVLIEGNPERPSLNWYTGQTVNRFEHFSNSNWVLTKKQKNFADIHSDRKCRLVQANDEWSLIFCTPKY